MKQNCAFSPSLLSGCRVRSILTDRFLSDANVVFPPTYLRSLSECHCLSLGSYSAVKSTCVALMWAVDGLMAISPMNLLARSAGMQAEGVCICKHRAAVLYGSRRRASNPVWQFGSMYANTSLI